MTLDLSTRAGVLNYAQRQRDGMVDEWRKLGRFERNGFSYGAILFCTHDVEQGGPDGWRSGPKLAQVKAVRCSLPEQCLGFFGKDMQGHTAARDLFALGVRTFARVGQALGAIFMGEMWMVTDGKAQPANQTAEERERALAEVAAFRSTLPDDLGQAPDRREALWMSMEHTALPAAMRWKSDILRGPSRLEPWQEWADDGFSVGRMLNLVEWRS